MHDLLDRGHTGLREAHNIDFLLAILTALEQYSFVEQVVEFAAVNFIETDLQKVVFVVAQQIYDIKCR